MVKPIVWACGGGTQSVAIAVLIAGGALPKPDLIVMADTAREATETWDYLRDHLGPLLARVGLKVEIAPHSLASADLWNSEGSLLMPAFAKDGKMSNFCSGYWKRDVCERYTAGKGIRDHILWLGISVETPTCTAAIPRKLPALTLQPGDVVELHGLEWELVEQPDGRSEVYEL